MRLSLLSLYLITLFPQALSAPIADPLPAPEPKAAGGGGRGSSGSSGSGSRGSGSRGSNGAKGGSGNSNNNPKNTVANNGGKTAVNTNAADQTVTKGGNPTTAKPNQVTTNQNGVTTKAAGPTTTQNNGGHTTTQRNGGQTTGNANGKTSANQNDGKTTSKPNTAAHTSNNGYALPNYGAGGYNGGYNGGAQYITRANGNRFPYVPFVGGLGVGLVAAHLFHHEDNTVTTTYTDDSGNVHTATKSDGYYVYSSGSSSYTIDSNDIITLAPSYVSEDLQRIESAAQSNSALQKFFSDYYSSINSDTWVSVMSEVHTSTETINLKDYLSYYSAGLPAVTESSEYASFLSSKVKDFYDEASQLTSSSNASSSKNAGAKGVQGNTRTYAVSALVSTFILALL